jgi:hypothetical protein
MAHTLIFYNNNTFLARKIYKFKFDNRMLHTNNSKYQIKINNNLTNLETTNSKDKFLIYIEDKVKYIDFSYKGRTTLKNKYLNIQGIYL